VFHRNAERVLGLARPRRGQFEAQRIERGSQRVCPTHSFVREFGRRSAVRRSALAGPHGRSRRDPIDGLAGTIQEERLESVDEVIFGCANQSGEDNRNVARMASLLAAFPAACRGNREPAVRLGMEAVSVARAVSSPVKFHCDRGRRGKHEPRAIRDSQGRPPLSRGPRKCTTPRSAGGSSIRGW